ncbi:hypothetical protein ACIGW8_26790 [Streptomyces sioyaensis]|uniref:hypothetical protein n=1 Tax=Streptomyces sioyaensis TaxID=67364 RepID=UPI0037D106F5
MEATGQAVTAGRAGDIAAARQQLLSLWSAIGVTGDPLHRCSLAHYLADLYEDPTQALARDVRALDAADAVTEQRVQKHHSSLHIAGSYPSLHLNLADNYRRLGSFEAATEHLNAAEEHAPHLSQDPGSRGQGGPNGSIREYLRRRGIPPHHPGEDRQPGGPPAQRSRRRSP